MLKNQLPKKQKLLNKNIMNMDFKEYLTKIEDPNYQGYVNQALPEDATTVDKMKFKLCKSMIIYQRNKGLTTEQMAKKIGLTVPEVKDILFSYINKFTLDRLATYADQLFAHQVDIYIERLGGNINNA